MKRIIFLLLAMVSVAAMATPVSKGDAQKVATHYLTQKGVLKGDAVLQIADIYLGTQGDTCLYVFNIGNYGYVLVAADDRSVPVLGYSTNGTFQRSALPINAASWFEEYTTSIQEGIRANAPFNKEHYTQWQELLQGKEIKNGSKPSSYLLSSTWEQGWGYNEYCPVNNGYHVVVGCVATAMAQVIRYYGYPNHGFGSHSYNCYYGTLAVRFDTAYYDYTKMPDHITYTSSNEEIHHVSQLGYHCGVSVNMTYQNPNHNSGSGAFTQDVPEALRHFGYYGAEARQKGTYTDEAWVSMLRAEIGGGHPLVYSGYSSEGGHAFVCDGYFESEPKFHFNWGWGGASDGFYSLTTMQGFTGGQCAIFNIRPSLLPSNVDRYYISANGEGHGSSWSDCSSDYTNIFEAASDTKKEVWMLGETYTKKEGTEYVFMIPKGVSVYGSFAATDTAKEQADPMANPTMFDGEGMYKVLRCEGGLSAHLNGVIVQNGYAEEEPAVWIGAKTQLNRVTMHNNESDSSEAIHIENCHIERSTFANNRGKDAIRMQSGSIRNSLIANNEGNGIAINSDCVMTNCDVVRNQGYGIRMIDTAGVVRNTLVWGNNMPFNTYEGDSVVFCAMDGEVLYTGRGNMLLAAENEGMGPQFFEPSPVIGYDSLALSRNWRLMPTSPCIDKADSSRKDVSSIDMDGNTRRYHGRVDIGCYEAQEVGIAEVEHAQPIEVYPNPFSTQLHVNNQGEVVEIYDMVGRRMIVSQQGEINTTALPYGVYILKVGSRQTKVVKR